MTAPSPAGGERRAVASGFCRLTVVSAHRRVDLTLPDNVPVAELLPEVAGLLGEGGTPVGLTVLGGALLPADGSLGRAGLRDGEIVYLVPVEHPPAEPVVDDVVVAVADATDARGARWDRPATRRALLALAGVTTALAAPGLLLHRPAYWVAGALLAVGAVLVAGPALVTRRRGPGDTAGGTAAVLVAGVFWVAGAVGAARAGGLGPLALLAATAGGVAAAAAGMTASGRLRWTAAPLAVVAAVTALAGLGAALTGSGVLAAAAGLLVGAVLLTAAVPPLALRLTGLSRAAADTVTDRDAPAAGGLDARTVAAIHVRARTAQRLTTAGLTGLLGPAAAAVLALALAGGPYALALVGVVVPMAALRARALGFTASVTPWAVLSGSAVVGLLTRLLLDHARTTPVLVAVPLAAGLLLVAAAGVAGRVTPTAGVQGWLGRLEIALTVALLPLALGAIGVYGDATDAGIRLH